MNLEKQIVLDHRLANTIISSHAVFNYLTAIQNQITFDQKRDAINALSSYARFLKKVTSLPQISHWTISEELELINEYLKMEKLRFGEQFDFTIHKSNANINVPTLLCVPFIELLVFAALKEVSNPILMEISIENEHENSFLKVIINAVLKPLEQLQRNTEQQERFLLLKQKSNFLKAEIEEKILNKQTQYILSITI
ncbi:MAG: histidine kinase [Bacteroidetes bacterium]|nr:histidine kinase [Bacteroidota bacterium]